MRRLASLAAILLAACGGGGGSDPAGPTATPPATYTDPVAYSSSPQASLASAAEIASITRHAFVLDGATINYTATAGHLSALAIGTNQPLASFFYVAYTAEGQVPANRPVTFFYNGGPGSASVWLHLGSFGPKRLATAAPSLAPVGTFPLVDNAESLLDLSDLVFVNAVGCGYSQAIAPATNSTFYGVDADAAVFRDFVRRYIGVNQRESSPKFLFGESYGGPRSAVLAHLLEAAGVPLKGVVLQSPAMNYNSNCGLASGISCGGFLPSYGAAAAHFERTNPPVGVAALDGFMAEMRTFVAAQYDPALLALPLPPAVRDGLERRTGIASTAWLQRPILGPQAFRETLIAGSILGRYDARMAAPLNTTLAAGGDPSSAYISARFGQAISDYLSQTLRYTTPSSYVTLSNAIETWDFSHGGLPLPDTIPDLATALALNPRLKVLSVSGYHDLATPFHKTETDLARLGPAASANLTVHNYPGGHMTYLDDASRVLQKRDLAAFYRAALGPAASKALQPFAAPARAVAAAPASVFQPPATAETPLLDPWVPPALAKTARPAPPTVGAALASQVREKLRAKFDAADRSRAGRLTRAQAREAGLHALADAFDAIDTQRAGTVGFDDWFRYLEARRNEAARTGPAT